MIDKEEIKEFLGQYISVGVEHNVIPGKLFFYYGYLKKVDDTEIKLETKHGFKIVTINTIMDIHTIDNKYKEYYGGAQ